MVDKEETNIGVHALLVTSDGRILLQQREEKKDIVNPGKITMFGGTIKTNEPLVSALRRELQEELEINIDNYKLETLGKYKKTTELDGIDYLIYVYVVKNVIPSNLKLHEGESFYIEKPEEVLKNPRLTRICRLAVEDYIKKD